MTMSNRDRLKMSLNRLPIMGQNDFFQAVERAVKTDGSLTPEQISLLGEVVKAGRAFDEAIEQARLATRLNPDV